MNFKKGETVIYPQHGACVVKGTKKVEAFGEKREYLILETVISEMTLKVPVDMAEEVGVEYGRTLAATMGPDDLAPRSFRAALHAVADALTAHGFAAHAEKPDPNNPDDDLRIVAQHCPFGDTAIEHPVICAVDRGLVKGMLSSLYGETRPATETTVALGSETCVTVVTSS